MEHVLTPTADLAGVLAVEVTAYLRGSQIRDTLT